MSDTFQPITENNAGVVFGDVMEAVSETHPHKESVGCAPFSGPSKADPPSFCRSNVATYSPFCGLIGHELSFLPIVRTISLYGGVLKAVLRPMERVRRRTPRR